MPNNIQFSRELIDDVSTLVCETDFDPASSFDCGQAFRWHKRDNGYFGIVEHRCVWVHKTENRLLLSPCAENDIDFWIDYLDLRRDYASIAALWRGDEVLEPALNALPGLRILRQPFWETLISFILSQNNNITRIKGLVQRLCETYGKKLEQGFGFPDIDVLAATDEEALRRLGLGYRAQYVLETARAMAEGWEWESLAHMPLRMARERLMDLRGVGPKVADCVLLFGCGRWEAFPVDVWIRRILARFPNLGENEAQRFERYGAYSGYVQQVLFEYYRKEGRNANQ